MQVRLDLPQDHPEFDDYHDDEASYYEHESYSRATSRGPSPPTFSRMYAVLLLTEGERALRRWLGRHQHVWAVL